MNREKFQATVYEPACGQGHIGKISEKYGYEVKAADICYRGYGTKEEVDFFTVQEKYFLSKKACKDSDAFPVSFFRGAKTL